MQLSRSNGAIIFWIFLILLLFPVLLYSFFPNLFDRFQKKPHIEPPPQLQTAENPHSWWSGLYQFPTPVITVIPGSVQIDETGFHFFWLDTEKTDYSAEYRPLHECTVGFDTEITDVKIKGYGDWNVIAEVQDEQQTMQLNLVQGSPTLFLHAPQNQMNVRCINGKLKRQEQGILISYDKGAYLIEAEQPEQLVLENLDQAVLQSETGKYRISFLPNVEESTITLFENQGWQPIDSTQADWKLHKGQYETYYSWFTSDSHPVLTTVWPHHQQFLAADTDYDATQLRYDSPLGELSLVKTKQLHLTYPQLELSETFEKIDSPFIEQKTKARLVGNWQQETLFEKSALVKLADQYVDATQSASLSAQLLEELDQQTAATESSVPLSHQLFAATTFSRDQLGQIQQALQQKVDTSFATQRFTDTPYLDNFWTYLGMEGISVATDSAQTTKIEIADRMHTWYSLYLWGKLEGDQGLKQQAQWLASQEYANLPIYAFQIPKDSTTSAQIVQDFTVTRRTFAQPTDRTDWQYQWQPASPLSPAILTMFPSQFWQNFFWEKEVSPEELPLYSLINKDDSINKYDQLTPVTKNNLSLWSHYFFLYHLKPEN